MESFGGGWPDSVSFHVGLKMGVLFLIRCLFYAVFSICIKVTQIVMRFTNVKFKKRSGAYTDKS